MPFEIASFPSTVPGGTTVLTTRTALAGNAGSSVLMSIPIPVNSLVTATVRGRASAGTLTRVSVTANAGADTLTASAGHGLVAGQPVFCVGTGQPGGVTATTVYYLGVATNTFKLYDTMARAVTNDGSTGLIDITSVGSGVYVQTTCLSAVYVMEVACRNRNGTTALLGSADLIALEDVGAWAFTAAANNTADTLEISGTPDGTLDTNFEVVATIRTQTLAI